MNLTSLRVVCLQARKIAEGADIAQDDKHRNTSYTLGKIFIWGGCLLF